MALTAKQQAGVRQRLVHERQQARHALAAAKQGLAAAGQAKAAADAEEVRAWAAYEPYDNDGGAGSVRGVELYAAWHAVADKATRAHRDYLAYYNRVRELEQQVAQLYAADTLAKRLQKRATDEEYFSALGTNGAVA